MISTFQIFNEGACIRIEQFGENGETIRTLVFAKDQVRTVDIIKDFIIRIDIGEGPLKNIYFDHRYVTFPIAASAVELRTLVTNMLKTEINDGDSPSELTQQSILSQIQVISGILTTIKEKETDFSQFTPSRVDESNPGVIYRGWHKAFGVPDVNEWAIERLTQAGDEIISEWAFGHKKQIYRWNDRTTLEYAPYDHDLPVPAPLP